MSPDNADVCWRSNRPWQFLIAGVVAALIPLLPNARVPVGIMLALAAASLTYALFLATSKVKVSAVGLTVRSLLLPRTYTFADIRGVASWVLAPPKYRPLRHRIFILFHTTRPPLRLREEDFSCPPGSMTGGLQHRFGVVEMPPCGQSRSGFEAVERRRRLARPPTLEKGVLVFYLCVLPSLIILGRNELLGRRELEVLAVALILGVPFAPLLTQLLPARMNLRIVRAFDGRCLHCGENLPGGPAESCPGCGSDLAEQDVVREFWVGGTCRGSSTGTVSQKAD